MIYGLNDYKDSFYFEKRTNEGIVTGWATLKIESKSAYYMDSSKVSKAFTNFYEMINCFDNSKTKTDEYTDKDDDYTFYDFDEFARKLHELTIKVMKAKVGEKLNTVTKKIEENEKIHRELQIERDEYTNFYDDWE